jgi:hypothetical protein
MDNLGDWYMGDTIVSLHLDFVEAGEGKSLTIIGGDDEVCTIDPDEVLFVTDLNIRLGCRHAIIQLFSSSNKERHLTLTVCGNDTVSWSSKGFGFACKAGSAPFIESSVPLRGIEISGTGVLRKLESKTPPLKKTWFQKLMGK